LGEALVGFGVGVVLSGLAAAATQALSGRPAAVSGSLPVAATVAGLVGLWVGLAGASVGASRRHHGGGLAADFGLRVAGWKDLAGGVAVGLACQYVLIPALYWPFERLDPALSRQLSRPAEQNVGGAHGVVAGVVLVVFLAGGAPLVEELFFRGLLLRALLWRTRAPVAIVLSGVLFALAHFEAVQFAGLAVFGCVLGYLAWRTGRLGPGMAAHAAFNGAAVVSLLLR
jgi:hypothetical protein